VEAYDCDAYGNTLIFSGPGTDSTWFTNDDVTSLQPACETIFTGRQYDPESQIYFYRARYYHPQLGRFVSRDHIGFIAGCNLYQYCDNAPILRIDAFGLAASTQPSTQPTTQPTYPLSTLLPPGLPAPSQSMEGYWEQFLAQNGYRFSQSTQQALAGELRKGCVGVVNMNCGRTGVPDLSECFHTELQANSKQKEWNRSKHCCSKDKQGTASVYLLRYNSKNLTGPQNTDQAGHVDMQPWLAGRGTTNNGWFPFDFGWRNTDGTITDANAALGATWPGHPTPAQTEIKTRPEKDFLGKSDDYDSVVYCVQCNYLGSIPH